MSHHDEPDPDLSGDDHLLTPQDGDASATEGDSEDVPQNGNDLDNDDDLDGGDDDAPSE